MHLNMGSVILYYLRKFIKRAGHCAMFGRALGTTGSPPPQIAAHTALNASDANSNSLNGAPKFNSSQIKKGVEKRVASRD